MYNPQELDDKFHGLSNIYRSGIPEHMIVPLLDYIVRGVPTGGFLAALLSNDLKETFGRADCENIKKVREFLVFLYNHTPSNCWGSPKHFKEWINKGGLNGHPEASQS